MRHFSLFDQIICRFDKLLKAITVVPHYTSANLSQSHQNAQPGLSETERSYSCALMRVNHSGEICAQALYLGQALVARNLSLVNQLKKAAEEEQTHLYWCKHRIKELGGRVSFLNPIWAVGSFGIGVIAGLASDKISLGFLAETEQQVMRHLDKHLAKISPKDTVSRTILTQMREDEERHAIFARTEGGVPLPRPICVSMAFASKIMTVTARYI